MVVKVVDASALGAFLFGEAEAVLAAAMLANSGLIAPRLLDFEIASIASKKTKREPQQNLAIAHALCGETEHPGHLT